MTKFDSLVCHLCNAAGTESCDERFGLCVCKPWYEGEYCQNCRFSRDYVLAPNGSCIPCNCGLRSIYECFQNNLCMKYAGESVKEAVAVSALFLSAIATITCVSVCIVWRIITRSKRLHPIKVEETDFESASIRGSSRADLASALSEMDLYDDGDGTNDRRFLLTPISADHDATSLFSAFSMPNRPSNTDQCDPKQGATKFEDPPDPRNDSSKGNRLPSMASKNGRGKIDRELDSKDCTKYIFHDVRRDEAGDEGEEENHV